MPTLQLQNKVVELPPEMDNLTTGLFSVKNSFFSAFANVITVKKKDELSLQNRLEIKNIKSFEELKDNWDSYNALPVSNVSIEKAIDFIVQVNNFGLDAYLTSPGPNGEVLVQLKNNEKEIEFIFYPEQDKYVSFSNINFVEQGWFDYDKLPDIIKWIKEDE